MPSKNYVNSDEDSDSSDTDLAAPHVAVLPNVMGTDTNAQQRFAKLMKLYSQLTVNSYISVHKNHVSKYVKAEKLATFTYMDLADACLDAHTAGLSNGLVNTMRNVGCLILKCRGVDDGGGKDLLNKVISMINRRKESGKSRLPIGFTNDRLPQVLSMLHQQKLANDPARNTELIEALHRTWMVAWAGCFRTGHISELVVGDFERVDGEYEYRGDAFKTIGYQRSAIMRAGYPYLEAAIEDAITKTQKVSKASQKRLADKLIVTQGREYLTYKLFPEHSHDYNRKRFQECIKKLGWLDTLKQETGIDYSVGGIHCLRHGQAVDVREQYGEDAVAVFSGHRSLHCADWYASTEAERAAGSQGKLLSQDKLHNDSRLLTLRHMNANRTALIAQLDSRTTPKGAAKAQKAQAQPNPVSATAAASSSNASPFEPERNQATGSLSATRRDRD